MRVTAVTVGPGDGLLIRYDGVLAQDDVARITAVLKDALPSVQVTLEAREPGSLRVATLEEATRLSVANPGRVVEVDG